MHAKVALLFPPLVNTSFGDLYPATAVLAGFLEAHGVGCQQLDLNREFAHTLLGEDRLRLLGQGHFYTDGSSLDPASGPAAAARLLLKNLDQLFDQRGRERFRRSAGPGYLLAELAEPYRLDLPLEESIACTRSTDPRVREYRSFYERAGIERTLAEDVALVGISVAMGPQLVPALILANLLGELRPDVRVVMGGPVLSLLPVEGRERIVEECPTVHALVVSDGEFPLLQLAAQASPARCWAPWEVAGVTALKDGLATTRPPAPGPALEDLPFASYDPQAVSRVAEPQLSIVQTRGCYWGRCAYCDYVELYEGNPTFRGRPPAHFLAEIEHHMMRHQVRHFVLVTESIPPGFARRFAELVIQRGVKIRWASFCMVDHRFTRELLVLMADAGCDSLVVGLETMVDRILHHVDKQATREENLRFIRDAHAAGIELTVNVIPDLPTTRREEALAALNDLESFESMVDHVSVFPFEATASSRIGRAPGSFGLVVREHGNGSGQSQFSSNHLEISDEAMSAQERREILAAYQEFAQRVNARNTSRAQAEGPDRRARLFDIVRNDFDLAVGETTATLRNWRLRTTWDLPLAWGRMIQGLESSGRALTRDELTAMLGDASQAERALRVFHRFGIVEPVVER